MRYTDLRHSVKTWLEMQTKITFQPFPQQNISLEIILHKRKTKITGKRCNL